MRAAQALGAARNRQAVPRLRKQRHTHPRIEQRETASHAGRSGGQVESDIIFLSSVLNTHKTKLARDSWGGAYYLSPERPSSVSVIQGIYLNCPGSVHLWTYFSRNIQQKSSSFHFFRVFLAGYAESNIVNGTVTDHTKCRIKLWKTNIGNSG